MIVIADTSPINFLVIIGQERLLPDLFGRVIIPEAVLRELRASATPQIVQAWVVNIPEWLEVNRLVASPHVSLSHLGDGEREASAC